MFQKDAGDGEHPPSAPPLPVKTRKPRYRSLARNKSDSRVDAITSEIQQKILIGRRTMTSPLETLEQDTDTDDDLDPTEKSDKVNLS